MAKIKEYVSKQEMKEILKDKKLVKNLRNGLKEVKNKKYILIKFSPDEHLDILKSRLKGK